jgi:hypothetical protein
MCCVYRDTGRLLGWQVAMPKSYPTHLEVYFPEQSKVLDFLEHAGDGVRIRSSIWQVLGVWKGGVRGMSGLLNLKPSIANKLPCEGWGIPVCFWFYFRQVRCCGSCCRVLISQPRTPLKGSTPFQSHPLILILIIPTTPVYHQRAVP